MSMNIHFIAVYNDKEIGEFQYIRQVPTNPSFEIYHASDPEVKPYLM